MNGYHTLKQVGLILLAGLVLAGCGAAMAPAATQVSVVEQEVVVPQNEAGGPEVGAVGGEASADRAAEESGAASPSALPTTVAALPPAPDAFAGGTGGEGPAVVPGASESGGGGAPAVVPPGGGDVAVMPDQQFQSNVTAGEIDDNADFSAYLQYRLDYMSFLGYPVHDVDISERHIVRVRTANGLPVLGAEVLVYDEQTLVASLRTPATGLVCIFPRSYALSSGSASLTVSVMKDQTTQTFTLTRQNNDDVWDVTLNVQPTQPPVKLDILFLLDSTGSMGDEIDQLKNNILSISAQIAALPSRPDVRFGMVTYRDRGDEYVTRVSDFTGDVQAFQSVLMGVQAAAGGDEPESLNEALHRAIHDVHWRVDNTVSLIFLVSDAPPHLDYYQDYDYAQEMLDAASLGIKIHPIASSGLNDQGEYIFRQLAQYTGGHFIFLTYEETPQSSGEPGTEHHVQEGTYTVEDLDALVVRLVSDELAALMGQGQQ